MKKTTITMISENKKNELPFMEVRSNSKKFIDHATNQETDHESLATALSTLTAYVIFALGFMMLGAAITLQVLAM